MRYRAGEAAFLGIIAALVGFAGFAVFQNIQRAGWSADAAGWAQAAGSIIAVAGAAWLARGEVRRARRWRREQGEEAAWGVRYVIMQAQYEAQIVAAELTRPNASPDMLSLRSWHQRVANASLGLQMMLSRVDHIHPAIVLSTCNAKVLVDGLASDLTLLEQCMGRGEVATKGLLDDIVYAHVNLATLLQQFDERYRGIREALDRGGDMLPLAEFKGR
ncbi:hypothetical protein [Phreatobacter stygius]|uniref:Uncharacterized protein n=1 Tax=Phreatobacter stygius TaxID=1940610 RepID=A0A4D7BKG3_9HYPH|nr:hypothetical protein [Phreatobacter stygius]QCI68237.1 hypothetical protein E8M01_30830 [Phreatobacter stygius]